MSKEVDKNDWLKSKPFSYRSTKEGKLMISYLGKVVTVVKGKKATALLNKLNSADSELGEQLLLAKETGNFKRGNEKMNKQ